MRMFDDESMRRVLSAGDSKKPVSGKRLAKYRDEFVPIANLKPGDKVQWKSEAFKDKKSPKIDEVVEVFRVLDPPIHPTPAGTNHDADCLDFSVLFEDEDGDLMEVVYDSRRFLRIV